MTDLIHLRTRGSVPIWYDAIMVFAFALTGLCLAFLSLWLVHRLVERRRGKAAGWVFVAAVAGLSGFGVYLGRYPRWNSWDVVTRPGELMADVAAHVQDPDPRALGVTLLMARAVRRRVPDVVRADLAGRRRAARRTLGPDPLPAKRGEGTDQIFPPVTMAAEFLLSNSLAAAASCSGVIDRAA